MHCQHAVCTSASDRTSDSSTADTYVRRMSGQQQSGLYLFRRLARAAVAIPSEPVGRKVLFNLRELFLLYRHERDPSVLATLREDAAAALRVLTWLRSLAEVSLPPQSPPSCTTRRFCEAMWLCKTELWLDQPGQKACLTTDTCCCLRLCLCRGRDMCKGGS